MEREKLKAKTALKNKVVGEKSKSKTKKQEELLMACKKGGSKKGGKTGKTGK